EAGDGQAGRARVKCPAAAQVGVQQLARLVVRIEVRVNLRLCGGTVGEDTKSRVEALVDPLAVALRHAPVHGRNHARQSAGGKELRQLAAELRRKITLYDLDDFRGRLVRVGAHVAQHALIGFGAFGVA